MGDIYGYVFLANVLVMNKKDFLDVRLPKSIEERSKISENKHFAGSFY